MECVPLTNYLTSLCGGTSSVEWKWQSYPVYGEWQRPVRYLQGACHTVSSQEALVIIVIPLVDSGRIPAASYTIRRLLRARLLL